MLKSNVLEWSCYEYENNCKGFVAEVTQVFFGKDHSLTMSYSIYANFEVPENFIISLYFDCNSDSFELDQYDSVDAARNAAARHHKEFMASILFGDSNSCI